jgi:predicted fused transcriptional regulator/phosphomethylpyrimidine kinase
MRNTYPLRKPIFKRIKMNRENEIDMFGRMAIALELIENCHEFKYLVPEVRSNLVFSKPSPKNKNDVLAIDGRITIVNGMPHASGKPKFGSSSHMARLIIELNKVDTNFRSGINFANNPHLAKWLEEYCRENEWVFSIIDRSKEPDEIKEAEGASMPWKVKEALKAAKGQVPKIFYETGAIGKEPVSVLVGNDPIEVANQICLIARLIYAERSGEDRKN